MRVLAGFTFILALLVSSCLTYFVRTVSRIRTNDLQAAQIRLGDSETQVRALLGEPTLIHDKRIYDTLWWEDRVLEGDPACITRELWYRVKGLPVSVTWLIAFDKNSKVVSKHRLD